MSFAFIPGDVLKAFSAKEVQFSKQQLTEVVNKFDSDGIIISPFLNIASTGVGFVL